MVYKILVFGDLPIASEVCDFIKRQDNCELVGVVIGNDHPNNNDPFELPILQIYAQNKDIPIYTLNQITEKFPTSFFDLGISARFSRILRKEHLTLFKIGVINFHGGLLPEYGGLYSANHALLNAEKQSGGTIHWIDEGIDTGKIIKRCDFQIDESDTVYSVFQKTQRSLLHGFISIFNKLLSDPNFHEGITTDSENTSPRYYDKNSLKGLKLVNLHKLSSGSVSELNRIRAFDFPGYEPAYVLINNTKVYLRLNA